ncbi:MAG TPA: NADH-quinone oxidoreductase subunit B family protein [Symbiobacteriaceae bacterium]|nr:NADH-quinone oxidoreductase subunit B family protein [Symbiobacteriaceae bacterium]
MCLNDSPELDWLNDPVVRSDVEVNENVVVGRLPGVIQRMLNWGAGSSVWPLTSGIACCAFEFMAACMPKYDIARFGSEALRASPRQADLMVVSGTVTEKMAVVVRRLYDQMAEPKYVIAMGACACNGGPYWNGYNVVDGVHKVIPVDVYVPGCPPRPEAFLQGLMEIQSMIKTGKRGLVTKG